MIFFLSLNRKNILANVAGLMEGPWEGRMGPEGVMRVRNQPSSREAAEREGRPVRPGPGTPMATHRQHHTDHCAP